MRNSKWLFVMVFFSVWNLSSCNLINPEENAPGFIEVNDFVFNPTPTSIEMGSSNSSRISDVWVYVDNKFLGAYELPARFPVLKTGKQKILLTPGIELNGCESFDGSGFSLAPTDQSDTIMYQLAPGDSNVFEGAGSGAVYLDTANTQFEFSSTTFYELPGSGAAVYLEMDYKCSQEMQIGLFIDLPSSGLEQVPIYNINPSQNWNKIYIQLGYVVSTYSYSNKFKIYFKGIKNNGNQKASFYFDNIKVVHF